MNKVKYFNTQKRRAARFCAVQILYEIYLTEKSMEKTFDQYLGFRLKNHEISFDIDEEISFICEHPDKNFLKDLIHDSWKNKEKIELELNEYLDEKWKISRCDIVLKSILLLGSYELIYREDIPMKVVIGEYINLTKSFFFQDIYFQVVNFVLDKMAQKNRSLEMEKE